MLVNLYDRKKSAMLVNRSISSCHVSSVLSLVLAFAAFSVTTVSGQVKSSAAPVVRSELRDLLQQFQDASVLHFRATVKQTISREAKLCCFALIDERDSSSIVSGELEYWAAGESYRVNSSWDAAKYAGMNLQVAYDGQQFQLLRPSASTLSYSSEDNAALLGMFPNPLLELLQFRYPLTDESSKKRLRLKDIGRDETPEDFWDVEWVLVKEDGRELEQAEFPGGTYDGQTYVHHVYCEPGHRRKPVRIDRVTARGVVTSAEFSHYASVAAGDGSSTFWPRRVVLRSFDPETWEEAASIDFVLTELSLDGEVPSGVFTIDTDRVARVWDDDFSEFVK